MARVDGLRRLPQADFSAGAFQGTARHLIPSTGLYGAENALFDEDAAVYKRGGAEYLTPAAVGTSMRMVWDGVLAVGPRTVAANTADYLVVNAAETAFVNISGAGMTAPLRATVFDGMLIMDDGFMYGGSYRTVGLGGAGAMAVTNGSVVVTVASGGLTANVDAGMLLVVNSLPHVYVVKTVDSDTQATLTAPYQGATDALAGFAFDPRKALSPTLIATADFSAFATIFNRLLVARGRRVGFTGGRGATGDVSHVFAVNDEHEFSGTVLGIHPIRDLVFVFTTDGVFVISGMALDLLDPDGVNFQQQVEPVNADLILWGKEGLSTYQNEMLVPGVDGLWAMGAASAPTLLSRSIKARWREHVAAGNKPGLAAVIRNHYHLPVLNAANEVVDRLVCRLDRPQDSGIGTVFPWSWWTGQAANTPALATRISGAASRQPKLLGADRATGRLLDLTGTFDPSDTNGTDADNSNFQWSVILRDYATGDGNLNHVRRLKIRYELVTVTGGPATSIVGFVGDGEIAEPQASYDNVTYDNATYADPIAAEFTQLQGAAPPDGGAHPKTWHFQTRARYVRARLVSTVASSKLILRSAQWYVRPSGNDR